MKMYLLEKNKNNLATRLWICTNNTSACIYWDVWLKYYSSFINFPTLLMLLLSGTSNACSGGAIHIWQTLHAQTLVEAQTRQWGENNVGWLLLQGQTYQRSFVPCKCLFYFMVTSQNYEKKTKHYDTTHNFLDERKCFFKNIPYDHKLHV